MLPQKMIGLFPGTARFGVRRRAGATAHRLGHDRHAGHGAMLYFSSGETYQEPRP
ncbi:Mycobacterium numidiamassiliense ORFan [Mycobacterium numidiamassiliense]|uniref:Mycobacterium numidiamassiliense ORFan n=1 Tax=Mycobacterium numidiamassiliense TaxID=1841861 RepID=A0A2U3PGE6_9MYCO|nr:Mycobacterium numidiamassiliense ORFan [Mycobacterium numidiamassiliense]